MEILVSQILTLLKIKKSPSLPGYRDIRDIIILNLILYSDGEIDDHLFRMIIKRGITWVKFFVERDWYIDSLYANIFNVSDGKMEIESKMDLDMIKYFIERGCIFRDLNIPFRVVIEGRLDILKYLVNQGYSIYGGYSPTYLLQDASAYGHLEIVKYLDEMGMDIHAISDYALRKASENGHIGVVKYLLERGSDIHAFDDQSLIYSAENGHLEVVKYLVEQGADINAEYNLAVKMSSKNGHLEVVKYLVEHGADIHNTIDMTALVRSAQYNHIEVVKYLVEQGSNVNAIEGYALLRASINGNLEVVKYLVEHGAILHKSYSTRCVEQAAISGHLEVVKYLVEQGTKIKDINSFTLITLLCHEYRDILIYLIEHKEFSLLDKPDFSNWTLQRKMEYIKKKSNVPLYT